MQYMGLSENVVYPIVPNGFADHYPYIQWLFHWGFGPHFQTHPHHHLKSPETTSICGPSRSKEAASVVGSTVVRIGVRHAIRQRPALHAQSAERK